jgi:biopolymer transport protein TolQ
MEQIAQFSILALFMKADIIVKSVMVGLGLTSAWSWAIMIEKSFVIGGLTNSAKNLENALAEGRPLEQVEEMGKRGNATARIIAIGLSELRATRRVGMVSEAQAALSLERMERVMNAQTTREIAKAEKGLGILATIGSSATFIGLFGTVWGIMNAFRSIAASHDTNLAVVAPGIAEALFATAMGLVAAIPAVIFYNWLTGSIDRYSTRIEALCDDVLARASRRFIDGGQ